MTKPRIPAAVLSDALSDAIAGRKVLAAVFTTYTFDPGFFELNVLPLLFAQASFSHVDKIRRVQLDEALLQIRRVAVYYDSSALAREATAPTLDFERIDVHRNHGVFHPKVVLVLVENTAEEEDGSPLESLIVGTLSANLTRSGWWESVEAGHFEEIQHKQVATTRCPYRRDLLALFQRLRTNAHPSEPHESLNLIHDFVLQRAESRPVSRASSNGSYHTRLFCGQQPLADWLHNELSLSRYEWNLDVISPFVDAGKPVALEAIVEMARPGTVHVFLPEEPDRTPRGITQETYDAVAKVARWCRLPKEVTARKGAGKSDKLAPRGVHAKVYRFWSNENGELIVVGSVNLTHAGHSHARAGNLEAAFVLQGAPPGTKLCSWLAPIDEPPTRFAERSDTEGDQREEPVVHVAFRFDWHSENLSYRIDGEVDAEVTVKEPSGVELFTLPALPATDWTSCAPDASARVKELLAATSFLCLEHPRGQWRVIIREEHLSSRPSLLSNLTPEEILQYWSLLSPAQKEAFIDKKLQAEAQLEGVATARAEQRYLQHNSMFARFAGIFHAFSCLKKSVETALAEGRPREAEARLFGERYDSLPALLSRIDEQEDADPVVTYVTYLCAQQLRDCIERNYGDVFWKSRHDLSQSLDARLARLPELHEPLGLPNDEAARFLDWYKRIFLTEMVAPAEARS